MADDLRRSVRAVAMLEAAKGVLALLAASGALSLMHDDLRGLALWMIEHAHLNPASHYPKIFLDAAAELNSTRLLWLAAGASAYAVLRLVEAWGLWRMMAWAEVLGAASAAIYVPFELIELFTTWHWQVLVLLAVNLLIVYVMMRALYQRRASRPLGQQA